MKREIKFFVIGFLIASILFSNFTVFADSTTYKITVAINSIKFAINGKIFNVDNILYNGTMYVPIRTAELLGKDVVWDAKTSTASINDKHEKSTFSKLQYVIAYKINNNTYKFSEANTWYIDNKKDYYVPIQMFSNLLCLYYNQYTIPDNFTNTNTYFQGNIAIKASDANLFYTSDKVYTSAVQSYVEGKINNYKNNGISYLFSTNPEHPKGVVLEGGAAIASVKNVLSALGVKCSFSVNEKDKIITIDFEK